MRCLQPSSPKNWSEQSIAVILSKIFTSGGAEESGFVKFAPYFATADPRRRRIKQGGRYCSRIQGIALLIAEVAAIGTMIGLVTDEPYMPIKYSIAHPTGPFVRMEDSCPSDASKHYFTAKTRTGKLVSVDLCLLSMSFGKNDDRLIPYKVDELGMVWGAASYSSEVSAYERKLEESFKIPLGDEEQIVKEISQRYRENMMQGFGYLVAGLAIFGGVVWAIGWIVRGFLGIPHGMDKRPN